MTTPRSRLRVIRENTQALQRSLSHLLGADSEFKSRLVSERKLWDENAAEIDADFRELASQLAAGDVKADIDDEVEFVKNAWIEAREAWRAFVSKPGTIEDRQARIGSIEERLQAMVRKIGFLTIPQRVAEFVALERTGGIFHFHKAFENELPIESDRVALLEFLAESPAGLFGIVDVKRGVIWAVSRNAWRRSRSYLGAALILLGGGVVAWFWRDIAAVLGVNQAVADRPNLTATYILVAAGVIGHILLDLYKESKAAASDSPRAVDDLILWGHVHEFQMYGTVFGVWLGTALLAALFNPIDPLTALLTGYSLDSVLDAALARFDTTITTTTKDLTNRISGAGTPA
jgi:hypothetical protein